MSITFGPQSEIQAVGIEVDSAVLPGLLGRPAGAGGIVLFAHGSGSSRHSPRNQYVANFLRNTGIATLLFDLLTPLEESEDVLSGKWRFNVEHLAVRLLQATDWVNRQQAWRHLPVGYFGASTGAAAALIAASRRPNLIRAVVSRGGRPDLAQASLAQVQAPTLLLVGSRDQEVLALNQTARRQMVAPVELLTVPGASHLFSEPGTLERVAELSADWFVRYLVPQPGHVLPG
ncbi:MAG: alpha/beta family hydrolase [Candidatus Sericytochromatia bacterium]|nr:alpha/beta family hydrolase [Candidatus Sericytochromatia bacterium]